MTYRIIDSSIVRTMALVTAAACLLQAHAAFSAENHAKGQQAVITYVKQPFTGDLDQMRRRQLVRVLVNYSKSNFFFELGRPRGFEYEMMKAYEKFLNKGVKKSIQKIKVVFIPMPFDGLLDALVEGKGDIAAAGLTITPSRKAKVGFTRPYLTDVAEVLVLNRRTQGINALDDLAGRQVYVRKGSSYVRHLQALGRRLANSGKPPVVAKEADASIVTEDILELVNAGVLDLTVADAHIARAWGKVLPDLVIREDLAINTGGQIAWAVRKDSPALQEHLNAFVRKHKKGTLLGNVLFERYYRNSKWIKNPLESNDLEKFVKIYNLFDKYAKQYNFSPLALAAQAYQESGLDNSKISPNGAVGIMQVLPTTASDPNIDIKNIKVLDNNIHAGAKYLDFLRSRYFSTPEMAPADRVYFSWAAYNAGPAKINRMRRLAESRGFDPDKWFFHVEKIAAARIGSEPVVYVSNINKYFVAYQLQYEMQAQRLDRKKKLERSGRLK